MPCRSPVAEWQVAHFAAKYFAPAAASPTSTLSSTGGPGGGAPCPGASASTLWMWAADRLHIVGARPAGDMRSLCEPRSTGSISSPSRSLSTIGEQQVRSAALAAAKIRTVAAPAFRVVNGAPARDDSGSAGSRCCAGKLAIPPRPCAHKLEHSKASARSSQPHELLDMSTARLSTADSLTPLAPLTADHSTTDYRLIHVHHASTGGSVRIARDSTSIAACSPSSIDASASSCSMLMT